MINKISNWVFGSFFRTIGRLLCFILLGFIIATILSKEDIKWTDLIGFETVNALSLDGTITGYYNVSSSFNISDLQKYEIMGTQGGVYNNNWSFNNYYTPSNGTNYIVFNYVKYFKHWDSSPNPSYEVYDNEINDLTITARIYFSRNGVGDNTNCEIQNNLIICPVFNNNSYRLLQIQVSLPESQPSPASYSDMYIGVDNKATLYSSATQSIIENQNQNQNQTMTFFNNENTTQAESSASNFFSSFSTQDNGGISSIITAPLNAISGLVNSSCSPIVLPLPYLGNNTLTLPCMSSIYQQHFGSFFTIYQTIIFGAVAYRMLVSIFMIIEGLKNPDDDKIEVVDL